MAKDPLSVLTEKQRAFAEAYVELGREYGTGKLAAIRAGYSESSAAQEASRLLHNEKVGKAIQHIANIRLSVAAVKAVEQISDIAQGFRRVPVIDPSTNEITHFGVIDDIKASEQLKANQDILDRAGVRAADKSTIDLNVNDSREPVAIVGRMAQILGKYGFGIGNLSLPGAPVQLAAPIDVECEPVVDKKAERSQRFFDTIAAHNAQCQDVEEEELRRAAREDAERERRERAFTEDDLEKEDWE